MERTISELEAKIAEQ